MMRTAAGAVADRTTSGTLLAGGVGLGAVFMPREGCGSCTSRVAVPG